MHLYFKHEFDWGTANKLLCEYRFQAGLLAVFGTLLYLPLFDNWYAGLAADDNWMVYENPYIANLKFENVKHYFTTFYRGQYSPVNTLVYGLIYQAFGLDPFYFHLMSFTLHLANALLVLTFFRNLLSIRAILNEGAQRGFPRQKFTAFLVALLFLIHPVQVEAVGWIAASKVLLYSFFTLLGLVVYLKYLSTGRLKGYWLCVVFFLLSFGAKEQAVVFPLLLLLADYLAGRSLMSRRVVLEKVPFILLAVAFGIISLQAQRFGFSHKLEHAYYPLGQRLILACFSYTEYIFKLFLPLKLSYWYRFPMQPGEALPPKYYFYVLVVLMYLYFNIRWLLKKRYVLVFGNAFLVVNIFLGLHVVPLARGVIMADRYLYLGGLGIFFIVAHYVVAVVDPIPVRRWKQLAMPAFLCLYLCALSVYTWFYIDIWNIG